MLGRGCGGCVLLLGVAMLGVLTPSASGADPAQGLYNLGVGIADITGPAAGVNMMGYANPSQINKGIHFRLHARAYIVDDDSNRFVFVNTDLGMISQIVKMGVVERLQVLYADVYSTSNVILSGIHTHSGPGGYLQYLLFDITSLGWVQDSYDAIIDGIVQSVVNAHNNIVPGRLYLSSGELLDASINRSPSSYLWNPEEERALYEYDTDKVMTLLKLVGEDGTALGMVNWFPVHPTSMNNTNTLISGDNKGYASQLFEKAMNPGGFAGEGPFVAAFAQSNCGDVSPNTDGPRCQDTWEPCDLVSSTCNGRVALCYAAGPGKDMQESTQIIGTKQFEKAMELYNDTAAVPVIGPVQFVSQQVDMTNYNVTLPNGTVTKTCQAALGFSFAAGTTDGPGAFDFTQGMTEANPFWSTIVDFVYPTSEEQIRCQDPKPVLLSTGEYGRPYEWHPAIAETQVARVGQLVIAAVPGEFTTMAGRRLRDQIATTLAGVGVPNAVPVIAGLSNVYTHYVTTNEEYQAQRYEAASTLYGPHTLTAYMQQYADLVTAMAQGVSVPPGPDPPNLLPDVITLLPEVRYDGTYPGYAFGDVIAQPYPLAYNGETVYAKFASGHPRNNPQLGGSFLTVERELEDGSWEIIAKDTDWSTKFSWERTSSLLGTSIATVSWDIPLDAPEGNYRISHTGHFKTLFRDITNYSGQTVAFKVAPQSTNTISLDDKRRKGKAGELKQGFLAWIKSLFG